MKKITLIFCLLIFTISCDRELEYSSNFDFNVVGINNSPTYINTLKSFQLKISNIINIDNNKIYSISYKVKTGTLGVKMDSNLLIENQFYTKEVNANDIIDLELVPEALGQSVLEIIVKDNNDVIKTKQISILIEQNVTPFNLQKINDFSVKNTLKKTFQFNLFNLLPTATYQIKFSSLNSCKIFTGTTQINMNTWVSLTTIPSNLYSYDYEANSETNDVLMVQVKDSYGQIETINYNVTIFSKPKILTCISNYNLFNYYCVSTNVGTHWKGVLNIPSEFSNNAYLFKVKVLIKNQITGNIDSIILDGNTNISNFAYQITEQVIQTGYEYGECSTTMNYHKNHLTYYKSQVFSVQIQDTDGAWSDPYNSIFAFN